MYDGRDWRGYAWYIIGMRIGLAIVVLGFTLSGIVSGPGSEDVAPWTLSVFFTGVGIWAVTNLVGYVVIGRISRRYDVDFQFVVKDFLLTAYTDVGRLTAWRPRAWRAMAGE